MSFIEYPKIYAPWKRDAETNKLTELPVDSLAGQFMATDWNFHWSEKIDGVNIRVMWDGHNVRYGGRTNDAQFAATFLNYLQDRFTQELFEEFTGSSKVMLVGEGVGPGAGHKGSTRYSSETEFILFDVYIPDLENRLGGWWLQPYNVSEVATQWGIREAETVDLCGLDTMRGAIEDGLKSHYGDFTAEGAVGRPLGGLVRRNGDPIIYKVKTRDF